MKWTVLVLLAPVTLRSTLLLSWLAVDQRVNESDNVVGIVAGKTLHYTTDTTLERAGFIIRRVLG
jgi:hypothetical protein